MSDLTAAHDAAFKHLSVQDDSAADAVSKRKQYNIAVLPSCTGCRFAQRRAVCVIGNADRTRDHFAEDITQSHVFPAQIVGIDDFAALAVDRPRYADAGADALIQRDIVVFQQCQRFLRSGLNDLFSCFCAVGRIVFLRDQFVLVIHQTDLCPGRADDDAGTDRICFLTDRCQQRVAFSFNRIIPASSRQEDTVAFTVRYRLAAAAYPSFSVQNQHRQE